MVGPGAPPGMEMIVARDFTRCCSLDFFFPLTFSFSKKDVLTWRQLIRTIFLSNIHQAVHRGLIVWTQILQSRKKTTILSARLWVTLQAFLWDWGHWGGGRENKVLGIQEAFWVLRDMLGFQRSRRRRWAIWLRSQLELLLHQTVNLTLEHFNM